MKTHLTLSLALLLACTGIANAQATNHFANSTNRGTPDGIPPSEEAVCDGLTGAAHGLCTAYCEAMDCDSGSPQASQTACNKVGNKFEQITGGRPPCGCPCVGRVEGYIEALNGDFGLVSCAGFVAPPFIDFVALVTAEDPARQPGAQASGFLGNFCGFAGGGGDALMITDQEAQSCLALVRQKAAEAGLTCPTAP
ncbi:MAG: hypothetical protein ABIS20_13810 [Thermoanaerobaculia bacterium]